MYLGIDEQAPGIPYVRAFNPSEFDKVVLNMTRLIKEYYPGIDLLNLELWGLLGFGSVPVENFLNQYIQIARENNIVYTPENEPFFIEEMENRFSSDPEKLSVYFKALYDLKKAGKVPDIIYNPAGYTPTELAEDIGTAATPAIQGTLTKILFFGVLAAGAYAAGPAVITAIQGRRAKRSSSTTVFS